MDLRKNIVCTYCYVQYIVLYKSTFIIISITFCYIPFFSDSWVRMTVPLHFSAILYSLRVFWKKTKFRVKLVFVHEKLFWWLIMNVLFFIFIMIINISKTASYSKLSRASVTETRKSINKYIHILIFLRRTHPNSKINICRYVRYDCTLILSKKRSASLFSLLQLFLLLSSFSLSVTRVS